MSTLLSNEDHLDQHLQTLLESDPISKLFYSRRRLWWLCLVAMLASGAVWLASHLLGVANLRDRVGYQDRLNWAILFTFIAPALYWACGNAVITYGEGILRFYERGDIKPSTEATLEDFSNAFTDEIRHFRLLLWAGPLLSASVNMIVGSRDIWLGAMSSSPQTYDYVEQDWSVAFAVWNSENQPGLWENLLFDFAAYGLNFLLVTIGLHVIFLFTVYTYGFARVGKGKLSNYQLATAGSNSLVPVVFAYRCYVSVLIAYGLFCTSQQYSELALSATRTAFWKHLDQTALVGTFLVALIGVFCLPLFLHGKRRKRIDRIRDEAAKTGVCHQLELEELSSSPLWPGGMTTIFGLVATLALLAGFFSRYLAWVAVPMSLFALAALITGNRHRPIQEPKTATPHDIPATPPPWWRVSLLVGGICALVVPLLLVLDPVNLPYSYVPHVGVTTFALVFVAVIARNPDRRFYRIATAALGAVLLTTGLPLGSGYLRLRDKIDFEVKFGDLGLVHLGLIALAAIAMGLDYRLAQSKPSKEKGH